MIPPMTLGDQTGYPRSFIQIEPVIDGIGIAWLEQSLPRHPMRAVASRDFEDGCAPLPYIWARIMIQVIAQGYALFFRQL